MTSEKETSVLLGLTHEQAEQILLSAGPNILPTQKNRTWISIFVSVIKEPMILLLIFSGTIYLFLGELSDALILLSSIFVIIGITYHQERKTEKTLQALQDLSAPKALVMRDGLQERIPSKLVVPGDTIILLEGDRIPADAVIIASEHLTVDESLLTGESIPVDKVPWNQSEDTRAPEERPETLVYSGSLVTDGRGVALVLSTGSHTKIGSIGKSLEQIKAEPTPLHKETSRLVKSVASVGLVLCLIVVVAITVFRHDFIQGVLQGLTLSMAILPEEFPVILLVFLTIGAWRISKHHVLARRSEAIETLGAATVLCTDKTGTLTLNKMKLEYVYCQNELHELDQEFLQQIPSSGEHLLHVSALACKKDPFDPIEKEIERIAHEHPSSKEEVLHTQSVKEYPISRDLLAFTRVWKYQGKEAFFIATKGAPEDILRLCGTSSDDTERILQTVLEMSKRGLRILGVAEATYTEQDLPEDQRVFPFTFVGLLGFVDPPRASVPKAVKEAYRAGIRIIMITGDYPGTAQYIAKQIGLKNADRFVTGDDLKKMDHLELRERIKDINIFARTMPEQKLLIVSALKANNEVVAMTGDGVNDAPALKASHIGVSMGERGTDVAREASSLILLNDDFSSIVTAVRLGRRIYDNIKRAMGYILSVHVPIAGISVVPIFFGFPSILLPAHIVFMEFLIDPACSIVFESEKEDSGIMKRPPRNPKSPMFQAKNVTLSLIQGLGSFLATFGLYLYGYATTGNETVARTFAFTALILGNLFMIIMNLSWEKNLFEILRSKNPSLAPVICSAIVALALVLYVPFLSNIFHLTSLGFVDLVIIVTSVCISLFWFELLKQFKLKKMLRGTL